MGKLPANRQITEGVIWKQLLIFFFPILLGSFFQQMYNTVDTIIVGRAVGRQALAAVGATSALVNLMGGFFIGLSSGATVILAQFYGAYDRENVSKALHTGMLLSVVLGLMVMALGILAGPWILRVTQTPESCMADAVLYVRIYFSGSVAFMIFNMGASILRAMGDSVRPTLFLIAACMVNIVMDIVCVVYLRMGVAGAAIATVLSQIVSAVLVVWMLLRQPEECRLHLRKLSLDGKLIRSILVIGIPAGLQFITFDLANLIIQSSVNSFGEITVAAWTAYSKSDAIVWLIITAFGVAVTTFVGQNFGAGKYHRIRRSVWVGMAMCGTVVAAVSMITLYFRKFLLGIYTPDLDVIRVGAHVMLYIVPFNVIFVPVEVFAGTMRGTGYSLVPAVITGLCACLFRILWVAVMVSWHHTPEMLALAYPVSWTLAAAVFTVTYFRGTWLKKSIAASGMDPENA